MITVSGLSSHCADQYYNGFTDWECLEEWSSKIQHSCKAVFLLAHSS
jgi:hypothetical protein